MMAKQKFDLGDTLAGVLGNVSGSDTQEQIEYIELKYLVSDERNFYSMDGVDELAANIELVGLQQPLRVLKGDSGFYVIVSGHRRAAALRILAEDAPEKWNRVPCIVEKPAASPELEELRLIFANSNTRTMSSVDIARQAERVEWLLYKLKEDGVVEFSGRMRDQVAAACKISTTKLAVLKAIKNNLVPELYAFYEKGEINESCAYELQKLPAEGQKAIAESCKRTGAGFIKSWGCERCVEHAMTYMKPQQCENGDECDHHAVRFVKTLRAKMAWAYCPGGCCVSCHDLRDCDHACKKAKAKKAEKKAEKETQKEDREKEAARLQKMEFQNKCKVRQEQAQRVLPLIEAAGLSDDDKLQGQYYYSKIEVGTIRKAAAGDFGDKKYFYGDDHKIIPTNADALMSWADKLQCSTDYLLGRTDDPQPAAPAQQADGNALQFRSGDPDHDCVCWCVFSFGEGKAGCQPAKWKGGKWHFYNINADIDAECIGWIELPDYEGVLRE